jgi:hypothetical protein
MMEAEEVSETPVLISTMVVPLSREDFTVILRKLQILQNH